jgi:hypothetical protein
MPMTDGDFQLVAHSIRSLRGQVHSDLDQSYSVNGALVLDQLSEIMADGFDGKYRRFDRDAFLRATQLPDDSGGSTEGGSGDPRVPSPHLVRDRAQPARQRF